ncbi:MAG: Holliday junction resolvase RuvX [Candidatus Marinimicrobia bacterium]|nr:Holliday junction resolvase RuvX [Candidatus Neomarinimicrobiota bacterium]
MGRVLCIDYGKSRIGLALSDPLQIIASPLKTIESRNTEKVILTIQDIVIKNDVELIAIGLPIALSGNSTAQTEEVKNFINLLRNEISAPVEEVDERLSSVEAIKILHKKGVRTGHNKGEIDKTAAAIILQTYLDTKNYRPSLQSAH